MRHRDTAVYWVGRPRRMSARLRRVSLAVLAMALGTCGGSTLGSGLAAARAARSMVAIRARTAHELALHETGILHSEARGGSTLDEIGHATGTYDCAITVHLTIISASLVNATFTVSPKGGTVSGKGAARFKAEGANGYFGGTIAITHGTGIYARAAGTGIGISGIINRETFGLIVHVHGAIRV